MAFVVPVVKKDYSIYSKKVAPIRSSSARCSFRGFESTEKLEAREAFGRRRNVSEGHFSPSLPDTRHVHFGQCETISYYVNDDDTLFKENEEDSEVSKGLETIHESSVPRHAPIPIILRSALRRSYAAPAMLPTKAKRQTSIRPIWKLAALCSPKN